MLCLKLILYEWLNSQNAKYKEEHVYKYYTYTIINTAMMYCTLKTMYLYRTLLSFVLTSIIKHDSYKHSFGVI